VVILKGWGGSIYGLILEVLNSLFAGSPGFLVGDFNSAFHVYEEWRTSKFNGYDVGFVGCANKMELVDLAYIFRLIFDMEQ
jgi:hypothetical protein